MKKPISEDSVRSLVATLARAGGGDVVEVEGEKVLSTKTVEVPAEVRIYFKKRDREPVEGVLSEELQALFAIYGELPVEAFGVMRNEVRKFEVLRTEAWNVTRLNPTNALVVYPGEPLKPGDVVSGVVEEVPLMPVFRGAVRSVKVRFLRDFEVASEETAEEAAGECDEVDLEKAVRGVAAGHFGDEDVKRLMLDALCRYDPSEHERTVVPFVLVAKSGGGKTSFARGLSRSFQAEIRGMDALTRSYMTVTPEGEIRGASFSRITVYDELDKWDKDRLDALLHVFGAEKQKRTRYGVDFSVLPRTFPVGTLLENWEELISERGARGRRQTLWQLVRRSVCLRLGGGSEERGRAKREYLRYLAKHLLRRGGSDDAADAADDEVFECIVEAWKAIKRAERLRGELRFDDGDLDAILRLLEKVSDGFYLGDNVAGDMAILPHLLNLTLGHALAEGRSVATYEDARWVCSVVVEHAKRLGMWREDYEVPELHDDEDDDGKDGNVEKKCVCGFVARSQREYGEHIVKCEEFQRRQTESVAGVARRLLHGVAGEDDEDENEDVNYRRCSVCGVEAECYRVG
ncbi:MAG: hypothetical protein ACXQTZ_04945, partial [Candidatus Alkanophagales archaeon]